MTAAPPVGDSLVRELFPWLDPLFFASVPSDPDEWIAQGAALRLTESAQALLAASTWERLQPGDRRLDVFCPASTTFDAAEALRLELVANVPTEVTVDVQIAPSLPGDLSAEDEAGERLHVAERAARLAPVRLEVDEEPFPWDE